MYLSGENPYDQNREDDDFPVDSNDSELSNPNHPRNIIRNMSANQLGEFLRNHEANDSSSNNEGVRRRPREIRENDLKNYVDIHCENFENSVKENELEGIIQDIDLEKQ